MKSTTEVLVKVAAALIVLAIVLIIIFVGIIPALQEKERFKGIPELSYYVTDDDYVLSADEYSVIESNCVYVDEQTSCEMAVLIVNDTGDRDINDFALRTFQKNGIGQEGKDNGVLIVLAIGTREWKVEVGYGLTYVLTTAYISDIGRNNVTPYLQNGEYGNAMIDMTFYLGMKIVEDYQEAETGDPAFPVGGIPLTTTQWIIIIIVVVILTVVTKGRIWYILILLLSGGKRGGGFGGGRSGGGGGKGGF